MKINKIKIYHSVSMIWNFVSPQRMEQSMWVGIRAKKVLTQYCVNIRI